MPSSLIASSFIGWFLLFVSLLSLGTVFFGQVLWFAVPVVAGNGCIGVGRCSAMAAVLGLWLQPSLIFIEKSDAGDGKPLFRPIRKAGD